MDHPVTPARAQAMFVPEPWWVRLRRWRPTVLQLAVLLSLALHGALLGLRFADPQDFNRAFQDTPLEVILVNARSQAAPTKAQAIAQAQLAGGGELDAGRAATPLPPMPTEARGDSDTEAHRQIEQMLQEEQQLLLQKQAELALMPHPDPNKPNLTPHERSELEHYLQAQRLLGEIAARVQEQNTRPRRAYVSPATREAVYAIYFDTVRRRIEDVGTRNYPTQGGRKLRGSLMLNLTVNARGEVIEVDIKQSSGQRVLDQRAGAIARQAGPFGKFTAAMLKQTDEITFTWQFKFGLESGLTATPMNGSGT